MWYVIASSVSVGGCATQNRSVDRPAPPAPALAPTALSVARERAMVRLFLGWSGSASGEGGGMFGKSVGEYLGFQKVVLAVIFVVWLVRLVLSLAGTPNATAKWVSVTVVLLIGLLYYGVAVHTRGFGSYKQLYPLALFQSLLGEGLVA